MTHALDRRAAARASDARQAWCTGTVTARHDDGTLCVQTGSRRLQVTPADSCLLQPEVGDLVACLRDGSDAGWLLAVLRRSGAVEARWVSRGDTRLTVHGGRLSLEADALETRAAQVTVAARTADLVGQDVSVSATRITLVGSVLHSVLERVQHFCQSYLRRTEGFDRVSAAHLDLEADELVRLEGRHTLVNARDLVKARGAQIHFG